MLRFGSDEHDKTGILTPGLPRSRLPALLNLEPDSGSGSLYPVTVAQPSPILTGFPDILPR